MVNMKAKKKPRKEESALELLAEVMRYRKGLGMYDFSGHTEYVRANLAFDAWMGLEDRIMLLLHRNKKLL